MFVCAWCKFNGTHEHDEKMLHISTLRVLTQGDRNIECGFIQHVVTPNAFKCSMEGYILAVFFLCSAYIMAGERFVGEE